MQWNTRDVVRVQCKENESQETEISKVVENMGCSEI